MLEPYRKCAGRYRGSSLDEVRRAVEGDLFWESYLASIEETAATPFAVHLAVFVEPYLRYVLDGTKTVESRFSVVRCAPFQRVARGDVILLKKSGGPVVGLCRVKEAWFYDLDPATWSSIREQFSQALCAQDPEFWNARRKAAYATLMLVECTRSIDPVEWIKRDRRGWVVVRARAEASLF